MNASGRRDNRGEESATHILRERWVLFLWLAARDEALREKGGFY